MQSAKTESGKVPCNVGISYTIWEKYEQRLDQLKQDCPHVRIGGKPTRSCSGRQL